MLISLCCVEKNEHMQVINAYLAVLPFVLQTNHMLCIHEFTA